MKIKKNITDNNSLNSSERLYDLSWRVKMGYQPLEKLLPQADYSIYKLVRMASKRAMELAEGAPKLIVASSSAKIATVAFEEIAAGKVALKEVAEKLSGAGKKLSKAREKEELEQEQKIAEEQHV